MKKLISIYLLAVGFSIFQTENSLSRSHGDFYGSNFAALTTKTTRKRSFGTEKADPESVAVVHVIRQELPDFIRQIAERSGLQAAISAQVVGLVQDLRLPVDLERIMPRLADQFQLLWHLDQKMLFVSSTAERFQSQFRMPVLDRNRFHYAIEASGLRSGNNDLTFLPDGDSVLVSGQKSFIQKIEQIFRQFDGLRSEQSGEIKTGGVKDDGN